MSFCTFFFVLWWLNPAVSTLWSNFFVKSTTCSKLKLTHNFVFRLQIPVVPTARSWEHKLFFGKLVQSLQQYVLNYVSMWWLDRKVIALILAHHAVSTVTQVLSEEYSVAKVVLEKRPARWTATLKIRCCTVPVALGHLLARLVLRWHCTQKEDKDSTLYVTADHNVETLRYVAAVAAGGRYRSRQDVPHLPLCTRRVQRKPHHHHR